jgi:serine/threonine protein kinase
MIFQDKPDQQLCDDDKLIAVLNDGDQTAEHQDVIEHIEQCPRCQQRFDELAAGAQDWTKVRQALLNDDPCSENRVGSAKWDYSLRNEGTVAWTESMASQLLSPASHPELLGRLGRYDVERLIGSGGMGVVFKAHDSELNRPVAIKILAPYLSSSGPARKRFAREARAAAAVVHEQVVPIYNVETEREIPFLVMHYIAGESLQSRIDREGALELCEILRIGMQVASGLSAAHQQGLVHRDIKPSNILMEQGVERALITDFGLARAADDASLTRTGFHPGTPQYMSPEQAAVEQVDARSDLFSLGSVLYTMCTGRPPFRAETSLGVLRCITDVEPRPIREINPNIPEWLSSLVARLMSKSPEDRFANALEVADLLGQCLAHVQQPAGMPLPVAVATTAPIRDRRPPIGKFIAAAAFAMALVFAGVFIVLESNKGTLTIQTEADDIRVRITQGDEVIDELNVTKSGQSVRVAAGQYKVEILGKTDELTVENEQVTLHRSGNELVRIIRKAVYPSEHQTTLKQLSADEWQGKLQGNWNVVQQYVDDGVPKRHSYSATVLRNRMEVIPTDGQHSMMFDLVLGEKGPPQQIDLKPVMSDLERHQLLQGWSSDNDEPLPEDLVNPIFHGIIELDSNGFRICNHTGHCYPRPIQFTDSSERVIWNFSKSELDESAEVRGTVDSEQPTIAKPLYADLQGDWIIDSLYIDEDSNSREWQKQVGGPVFIGAIKVTANELYFRNLPSAGMTRTKAAIALEPVEGNDPRLFRVVDSRVGGEDIRFGMYKVDGDKLTILPTQEAQPKLLAPTEGEYYIECHRPVSEEEKGVLYAIDNLNPDQMKIIDRKLQDAEQSVPAQGDATTPGNVSETEKTSPTQTPDASNGESMDPVQEVAPPSMPDATSKLDFFTEGNHKLVITGDTSRSEYMHLRIGDELDAPEWILGPCGRFIATFEYSDELSVKGGKKANGLRIGGKHGNGNVSRLQIEMTPVDAVSASSFRFCEGAIGNPPAGAILHHERKYRIGDVETIDGKKLPVFVQLKIVTNVAGPNSCFLCGSRYGELDVCGSKHGPLFVSASH